MDTLGAPTYPSTHKVDLLACPAPGGPVLPGLLSLPLTWKLTAPCSVTVTGTEVDMDHPEFGPIAALLGQPFPFLVRGASESASIPNSIFVTSQ